MNEPLKGPPGPPRQDDQSDLITAIDKEMRATEQKVSDMATVHNAITSRFPSMVSTIRQSTGGVPLSTGADGKVAVDSGLPSGYEMKTSGQREYVMIATSVVGLIVGTLGLLGYSLTAQEQDTVIELATFLVPMIVSLVGGIVARGKVVPVTKAN